MRSKTAAALVAVLACGSWAAAQTPSGVEAAGWPREKPPPVRLSPAALRKRVVTCKAPTSPGRLHVRGVATVAVLIDEEGRVSSARVVSGHPLLHASAVQAASKWTFRPVRAKGKRVKADGLLTLIFSPDFDEMQRQCKGLRRAP